MTIAEYAEFAIANGEKVIQHDGIWWRKVRLLFYRPLFPLQEISPHAGQPPLAPLLSGYQHLVSAPAMANSRMNFLVFAEPQTYALDQMKADHRNKIKKAMKAFTIRELTHIDEFVSPAFPVYLSFYSRTGYGYKKERCEREGFVKWAEILFAFPKILVLGAYQGGELSAIQISYRVENVIMVGTSFSRTDALRLRVTDAMVHALRQRAAADCDVKYIFRGGVTGKRGLDESKTSRGCVVLSKPAFYSMNRIWLFLLKTFMRGNYEKLLGQYDSSVPAEPYPCS